MDKMKLFVIWLDGYMAACGPVMTENQTSVVKDRLNNLFEHVAEPVEIISTSLQELGEIHGFPVHEGFPGTSLHGGGPNSELYRC